MANGAESKEQLPLSIEAAIFDKDGVLMLTEEVYFEAYRAAIVHFGGKGEYTWKEHQKYMGSKSDERFLAVRKKFALKVNLDEFLSDYRRRYMETFQDVGIEVPRGTREILSLLRSQGIKLAVATGASRKNAEFTLEETGLRPEFEAVITADDVAKGKPDPELFLLAALRLRVEPYKCLVVGDAQNDVEAAKAAGMKVVAVVDTGYTRGTTLIAPDLEVHSLEEISLDTIKSL